MRQAGCRSLPHHEGPNLGKSLLVSRRNYQRAPLSPSINPGYSTRDLPSPNLDNWRRLWEQRALNSTFRRLQSPSSTAAKSHTAQQLHRLDRIAINLHQHRQIHHLQQSRDNCFTITNNKDPICQAKPASKAGSICRRRIDFAQS